METVLITGASSGIGRRTARRLRDEGYDVYGASRRLEKMVDLEDLGVTTLKMDLTEDENVAAVVDRVRSEAGGIDVLINNAGFGLYGAVEDVPLDEARYQFEVNLFGLARLTKLVLPGMRERGDGTIVNVSSMGGKIYTPLGAWYHASKHALEGWSDCLRIEVAPFGIDVVLVEPGVIETEFGDVLVERMLEHSGRTAYAVLARRVAEATRESYEEGNASPPSVVAGLIAKALSVRRPRTRYVGGRMARSLMTVRKWLGDRIFDRLLMSQV